jgi:hypothetical protein
MRLSVKVLALAIMLGAIGACGGAKNRSTTPQPEQPRTTLIVDNRGPVDMTIYVLRGAQRYRLGICPGTTQMRFTIPSSMVFGATPMRFLADPIGSSRTPVSNEIPVRPGDEVHLLIPWTS